MGKMYYMVLNNVYTVYGEVIGGLCILECHAPLNTLNGQPRK